MIIINPQLKILMIKAIPWSLIESIWLLFTNEEEIIYEIWYPYIVKDCREGITRGFVVVG